MKMKSPGGCTAVSLSCGIRLLACWLALAAVAATAAAAELGIQAGRFTVDGTPTFLYGISYYGALGAPQPFVLRDLDDMQKFGFNWIRVWATWSAFGRDVSAVDHEGRPRKPYMDRLKWLVAECDRRGMIVDVTLTKGEGRLGQAHVPTLEAHGRALETLAAQLKPWRNWYCDLCNEHNLRRRGSKSSRLTFEQIRQLRDRIKQRDAGRLVTASHAGELSRDQVRRYLLEANIDFLSPHRPRNRRSARENQQMTAQYLAWMRQLGRVVPVHDQEPFRRDFSIGSRWQPEVDDFVTDLRGALEGGAAGWCLHNGDNRWAKDGRPRRCFDLREKRLFEQLDSVEREALTRLRAFARPAQ